MFCSSYLIVAKSRLKFVTKLVKSQVQLVTLPRSSEKNSQRIWTKYLPQCWYKNWANWFEKLRLWCLSARWNRKNVPGEAIGRQKSAKMRDYLQARRNSDNKSSIIKSPWNWTTKFSSCFFLLRFSTHKSQCFACHQETFCFDLMEFSQWAGSWFFAKTLRGKLYFRRHLFSVC